MAASIAAGTIAIGALTATAPPAYALSEQTIQKECLDAGGTYSSGVDKNGDRQSSCLYTDSSGDVYMDNYTNGAYTGTNGPLVRGRPTTPVPRPTNLPPPPSGTQSHLSASAATR